MQKDEVYQHMNVLQMQIESQLRTQKQFCTSDYEVDEKTAFQIVFNKTDPFIRQTLSLVQILNQYIKKQKEVITVLALDFIQDENDQQYYMLQIKHIETAEKISVVKENCETDYVQENKQVRAVDCPGEYCGILEISPELHKLPEHHKDFIWIYKDRYKDKMSKIMNLG